MESREIVGRAIEFDRPPRFPFLIGPSGIIERLVPGVPDDIYLCCELNRSKSGWVFGEPGTDDWGCVWETTDIKGIGQVKHSPLEDWSALGGYSPPDPTDEVYFERIPSLLDQVGEQYVVVLSHFNLIERLHLLRGFTRAFEDFYLEPEKVHRVLDMILDFKVRQFDELARRAGERVHQVMFEEFMRLREYWTA